MVKFAMYFETAGVPNPIDRKAEETTVPDKTPTDDKPDIQDDKTPTDDKKPDDKDPKDKKSSEGSLDFFKVVLLFSHYIIRIYIFTVYILYI